MVCPVFVHEEIKADVTRFRSQPFLGIQDFGVGPRLELRNCGAQGCGSTLAICVGEDGEPVEDDEGWDEELSEGFVEGDYEDDDDDGAYEGDDDEL